MKTAALLLVLCLCSGCQLFRPAGFLKVGDTSVQAPKNPGTPATVNTTTGGTTVPLPAGSTVTVTETAAQPAQPATKDTPAQPAQPAKKVTEITPAGPTEYHQTETATQASTGTVDTSVAMHAMDVAERRWLLFTAIGCGIAGILARSLVPAWPAISNGLLGAAVVAGLAWKFAEIPAWLFLVVIGLGALMVATYKRAEWDKNGDGIPDALQKK